MSFICDNCGKVTVTGRTHQHKRGIAGKRWLKRAPVTLRTFSPNLQRATVLVSGKAIKMKLCTKCIKRFKKEGKIKTRATRTSVAVI